MSEYIEYSEFSHECEHVNIVTVNEVQQILYIKCAHYGRHRFSIKIVLSSPGNHIVRVMIAVV